jgi:hypothetical protein
MSCLEWLNYNHSFLSFRELWNTPLSRNECMKAYLVSLWNPSSIPLGWSTTSRKLFQPKTVITCASCCLAAWCLWVSIFQYPEKEDCRSESSTYPSYDVLLYYLWNVQGHFWLEFSGHQGLQLHGIPNCKPWQAFWAACLKHGLIYGTWTGCQILMNVKMSNYPNIDVLNDWYLQKEWS